MTQDDKFMREEKLMRCPTCSLPPIKEVGLGEFTTLVGYHSPEGHNHDDNCVKREYICANRHHFTLSIRRSCPCGWLGKEDCFCHKGIKISKWPEVPRELLKIINGKFIEP